MEDYKGKELEVLLPSGFKVSIREQNGDDDDVLSQVGNAKDGTSYAKFAAGIITKDHRTNSKVVHSQLMQWKVNDLDYLILASRVYSLGAEVEFKVKCSNTKCGKTSSFEEDITNFLHDFKKPLPLEGDNGYFSYKAKPYPKGEVSQIILPLTSGKVVRYDFLTVAGQNEYLNKIIDEVNANMQLTIRNIALQQEDKEFMPIVKFAVFSSMDMKEIRTSVKAEDVDWEPVMECICPYCKNQQNLNILQQSDFFYPLGK